MTLRKQRGQATVELVLLTPLLLVLLFLIVAIAWVFGSWLVITNAAREGARLAVVLEYDTTSDPEIKARVQETAEPAPPGGELSDGPCSGTYNSCIEIFRYSDPENPLEKLVSVMARYKVYAFPPIAGDIPFIGPINYPGYIEIVGLSTMRWE